MSARSTQRLYLILCYVGLPRLLTAVVSVSRFRESLSNAVNRRAASAAPTQSLPPLDRAPCGQTPTTTVAAH